LCTHWIFSALFRLDSSDFGKGSFFLRYTEILNATQVKRTTFQEAVTAFQRHCKLKNLRPKTLEYGSEDLNYFHAKTPVRYIDEVTQEVFENFILKELETGKKTSSLNTRIRGLRVFFKFCAERDYMPPVHLKLMREDDVPFYPAVQSALDNPVPTVFADVDFSAQKASGKYVCSVCGYVYDPAEHDGVAFEDLPDDWKCPRCKQGKEKFNKA